MVNLALDIDGTICSTRPGVEWDAPLSVLRSSEVYPKAQERVKWLMSCGWEPMFISGRHTSLLATTIHQLRKWFGDMVAERADVILMPERKNPAESLEEFHNRLVLFKSEWLNEFQIEAYIGDSQSDRVAAEVAGCRFVWAHDWRGDREETGRDSFAVPLGRGLLARSNQDDSTQGATA